MLREPGLDRGSRVRFSIEGREIEGFAGESVAAALMVAGIDVLRLSPRTGEPRGAFCWMGLCQECTMVIDGIRRPACRTAIRSGMSVALGSIG